MKKNFAKMDEYELEEYKCELDTDLSEHSADRQEATCYYLQGVEVDRYQEFKNVRLINVKSQDKESAINTVEEIKNLFGRGGKFWIKRFYGTVHEGVEKFCLMGGAAKVDGKFEAIARAAIVVATVECNKKKTGRANLYDIFGHEDIVTDFNDSAATQWKDVLWVLNRAKKLIEQA